MASDRSPANCTPIILRLIGCSSYVHKLELDNGLELGLPLYRLILMHMLVTNMTALAVGTLYYLWRAHHQEQVRRRRILRERVAFLLWTVAGQIQNSDSGLSASCRG